MGGWVVGCTQPIMKATKPYKPSAGKTGRQMTVGDASHREQCGFTRHIVSRVSVHLLKISPL